MHSWTDPLPKQSISFVKMLLFLPLPWKFITPRPLSCMPETYYNILLFLLSFVGGSIPLWAKNWTSLHMNNLLAFSGSFLLGITLLHMVAEGFDQMGHSAGLWLLVGFFIQLFIQRFTHGAEHGHHHQHEATHPHHHHHLPLASIFIGLSFHAFMEGLPLGSHYHYSATEPSLYLGVAAHKLPEAMLMTSLMRTRFSRQTSLVFLFFFSLITPFSGGLAHYLAHEYPQMARALQALIPVVAGAFLHISTTIFYESGSAHHRLNPSKVLVIIVGIGLALATLGFE